MTTKKSTASLTKGLVATKNSGSKPRVNSVVKTAEGKPTAHKHRQNSSAETAPTEANIVHSVVRKTADHDESQEAEAESVVLSNEQYKPTGPSVIKAVEEKSTTHKQQRNSSAKSEAQPEANVIASSVHTVVGKTAHHDESRKARAETVTLSNKQCKNNVDCNLCTSLTKKMEDAFNQIKKLEKKRARDNQPRKKMEKKAQDATAELRKSEGINTQLKQALKDKEKMLVESTRLNIDLQSKVLAEFDELKVIIADMKQRAQTNLEKNQGVLPIGYRRLDKSMIHLGQDVWISIPQYDSISSLSDTAAKFVKNMAIAVYGTPTLKASSVTGNVSNRIKNKNKDAIGRPKLDPTKLLAIKEALRFWLTTEKNLDEVSIDIEVTRVGSHISHKIFELLRKDKKGDTENNTEVLPVTLLEEERDSPPRSPERAAENTGQESEDDEEGGNEQEDAGIDGRSSEDEGDRYDETADQPSQESRSDSE